MKTLTILLCAATFALAQDRPVAEAQRNNPPAAAAPAIPKNATEVEPNLYRFTDAKGKVWLARRTPFGFSTWEETATPASSQTVAAVAASAPADSGLEIRSTDLGDKVRFERQTPFGVSQWTRSKADLTDEEKGWLAGAKDQPAPKTDKTGQQFAEGAKR